MYPEMRSGTVLVAAADRAGRAWFAGQLDLAGQQAGVWCRLDTALVPEAAQAAEAICFDTSYDALQVLARIMAAAPLDGVDISLGLAAFGWGDSADPLDAAGAVAQGLRLLAVAPPGTATTCGSVAMVAGPLLGPSLTMVWTENVVDGPGRREQVFRFLVRTGEPRAQAPCVEWARRWASGTRRADPQGAQASDGGLPRLAIARPREDSPLESEIARLALQAHARGDVVLRLQHPAGPAQGDGRDDGRIILLDVMLRHLSRQEPGTGLPVEVRQGPGFSCLDDIEMWLRALVRQAPATLVVPDVCAVDEASRVVIERLLQDASLPGFSVIAAQPGDAVPDVLRQLMSKARRTGSAPLLVSQGR
ncbi:UNVERIFIED_CONTAM: hypothetical protein Q9R71_22270 [Actinomycetes bacterium ARC8]|nr:hypothetical protein [Actinomycetes bacterium ARC8]